MSREYQVGEAVAQEAAEIEYQVGPIVLNESVAAAAAQAAYVVGGGIAVPGGVT